MAEHQQGCECGPWVNVSRCAAAIFRGDRIAEVACPGGAYPDGHHRAPVVQGVIGAHEHDGELCPWAGVRVVDDRLEFARQQRRASAGVVLAG